MNLSRVNFISVLKQSSIAGPERRAAPVGD